MLKLDKNVHYLIISTLDKKNANQILKESSLI